MVNVVEYGASPRSHRQGPHAILPVSELASRALAATMASQCRVSSRQGQRKPRMSLCLPLLLDVKCRLSLWIQRQGQ